MPVREASRDCSHRCCEGRRYTHPISKGRVWIGWLTVLVCGLLLGSASDAWGQERPNVILILADDQAWNGTSVRMDPDDPRSASDFYQTPNLESLAASGMRFSNAYSAASVCSPTRAALQTGKSPAQLSFTDIARGQGIRNFDGLPLKPVQWREIAAEEETLAERVKAADPRYVTAAIGKWHLRPDSPLDLGYDIGFNPVREDGVGRNDPGSVFAKTDAALSFLDDRVSANDPFFLQLNHFAVHNPIESQPEVLEKYQNLPRGNVHDRADYAAFTEALDTAVGQVLDRVQDLGIADNTYIIYASDNGARDRDTSNFPLAGQKNLLLEGGIRTPLFIKGPGIQGNTTSHVPVTTVDLFATVSDLVGNTTPFAEGVEGASLKPLLENQGDLPAGMEFLERQYSDGGALFFSKPHNLGVGSSYRIRPMSAVRKGDFKLLRIHGENGADDEDLLFDLSRTLSESEYGGALDRSGREPEKVAELSALLDNWIQEADASLAYDVSTPVDLAWRADVPGSRADRWRSLADVDHRWRETWEVLEGDQHPESRPVTSHLVNAPQRALVLNAEARLARRFFHVSDAVPRISNASFPTGTSDFNRSVAFEIVLRLSDLDGEQVLFESGDADHGLSITLGDADGDGRHDEARFRVLSDRGESLQVTGDIDDFASPTTEFIQLTAVYNDNPADRHLELFVNGSSIGRADGVTGDGSHGDLGSLRWDRFITGFRAATLGGTQSEASIGANGGDGPRPFTGGAFRGELASFRFINHAIDGEEVLDNYESLLLPADYGIRLTAGDVTPLADRPVSIAAGALQQSGTLVALHERQDILATDLAIDVVASSGSSTLTGGSNTLVGNSFLPAGTEYRSYLLHFDSPTSQAGDQSLMGSITFDTPILGLLFSESTLDASELITGVTGSFALGDRSLLASGGEGLFSFSDDLYTLNFDLTLDQSELTQLRVLTATREPGDYNSDGVIDAADFLIWKEDYGAEGIFRADGNGDGVVDIVDYNVWRDRYTLTQRSLGDFNGDGATDIDDYHLWKADYGSTAGSPADANRDGVVDLADYSLWRDNIPPPPSVFGDYNGDGVTDAEDYLVWKANYGATDSPFADGNLDGVVDIADYTIWRDNFVAAPPLAGDFSGDGVVDAADYLLWKSQYGLVGDSPADSNGDGVVNAADFTIWRDNYDASLASTAANIAVPEPATLLLVLASVAAINLRRRR
ncbi:MAG: sulfatase-like hydrolase/transferase [Planctomycetota bacterium]